MHIRLRHGIVLAVLAVGLALGLLLHAHGGRFPVLGDVPQYPPAASSIPAQQDVQPAQSLPDTLSDALSEEEAGSSSASLPVVPDVQAPEGRLGSGQEDGRFVVRFLDVGQGDCALISCEGHHMLIDGGPREASRKVYAVLQNLGISHLDYIVATHADADHVGGISAALNAASCDVCYCSVEESDTRTFESMTRYVKQSNAAFVVPDIPTELALGEARLSIIGPPHAFPDSDNNGSLVCRIDYGQTTFLFMGDAEIEAEQALLDAGVNVRADLIKIGHHGSAHSTSEALIEAVQPSYAVISVGADNGYGHPTRRVLDLLQRHGVEIHRTDLEGDIIVSSDGQKLTERRG